jgi:hypothetical protein
MNVNGFPKMLADKIHLSNNQFLFFISFTSGDKNISYGIAPQTAKGFIQGLKNSVEAYEKNFGPIDMNGFESGIESPIQIQ